MKKEPGMAYNTKTLNKVFAALSVLLFLTAIWVFTDDFVRPWKKIQIDGMKVKRMVLSDKINKIDASIDKSRVEELERAIEDGNVLIEKRSQKIKVLEQELTKIRGKQQLAVLDNSKANATVSATTFEYEMALEHGAMKKASKLERILKKGKKDFAEVKNRIKWLDGEERRINGEITDLKSERLEAEKKLEELIGTRDRLLAAKEKTKVRNIFDIVRNSPMLDFLDPTLKIHQVVLADYTDDRYFRQTEKVDRCTTCHLFIDQPGYAGEFKGEDGKMHPIENPFKSHPNLELMVGPNSPHPMKKMGCTNCHGGEGHRVQDMVAVAHIPQDEKQKKEWIEKYHWHAPHKVPKEMYRVQYTESQCFKCHQGVENIPEATVYNEGKQLIESYGCYGCHKMPGFEEKRKPGPSLEKVASKVSKEWAKNWIWSPHTFNKKSRMPSFFAQSNNSKDEFMIKNVAEVNAMAEYIWDKSEKYSPKWSYSGGDVEKGKELIQEVGCLGCHQVEGLEDQYTKSNNQAGPYLTGLGSKLSGDWLMTWLIKPSHYDNTTIMPSFRLTKKEASDITAFLLNSKNKNFEKLKFSKLDKKVRDGLLLDYLSTFDTKKVAQMNLAKMNDRERTLELGRRSINKYGCYSCHDIDGFSNDLPPIGPELSKFGSKPITQVGFGHQHIEHRLDTWVVNHLENPRQWDHGTTKPFKDLNRMPNFYLNQNQIRKMTTVLLGYVDEKIPMRGVRQYDGHEKIVNKAEKVIDKYNCMGCHKIDGQGGEILKNYEDVNEGPPWLVGHGERVETDWLHNFMKNVYPIRPYLKVRMPSFNFTEEERNDIVNYFLHKSKMDIFEPSDSVVVWEPGERKAALQLWEEYACTSCHTGGFNNDEPQAPNLKHASQKLRSPWIEKWLKNPQAILPETVMTNFWPDGEATNTEILGGDPQKQITALRKLIEEFATKEKPAPFNYLK